MGATGKGTAGPNEVAAAIKAKCEASGCDFVQLLGNNIYDAGVDSVSDAQWDTKFEAPYAAVDLPFYAVLGNHDYGGYLIVAAPGLGNEFFKGQFQVDYTSASPSGKWKMPANYWHRRLRDVEFIGLDSNLQMWDMDAAQRSDVAAWLAASTAKWKIVFGLHSYRSNGRHGNAGNYDNFDVPIDPGSGTRIKSFMDDIVCGHADLHISAYDHNLQWMQETCAGTELIVSGAGSSVNELIGSQPTHYQSPQLGFVYVVIDGNTLTAEFIGTSGAVLFTRRIDKP
jgi:hypothetical protein